MPGTDNELERLKRLREQQIAARDPLKKQRKSQREVTRKYRARKYTTLKDMFDAVSHKWVGLLIGFMLGIITWILLASYYHELWVDIAGIIAMILFPAIGVLLGSIFDWRDNLRNF